MLCRGNSRLQVFLMSYLKGMKCPITKEDVRSLVISKLRLKHGFTAIDIGCGSGSITVELCIQTKGDNVYGIDFDKEP